MVIRLLGRGVLSFSFFWLTACSSGVVVVSDVATDLREVLIEEQGGYISFVGTIVYLDHFGGVYGIRVGEKFYDPMQLPSVYRQQGMRVKVKARLRDRSSERHWGQMVHIVSIEDLARDKNAVEEEG